MNEIIIHVTCNDRKGVIAQFTQLLYKNNVNIRTLEQHVDSSEEYFFMRIHADLNSISIEFSKLISLLEILANKLNSTVKFYDALRKLNIAIFCTKESQPVVDLLMKQESKEINCNISAVISNHELLHDIVNKFGNKYFYLPINKNNKEAQESEIFKILDNYKIDLVVLARYMQILSPNFLLKYRKPIINIHHGFLPAFKGNNPYRKAWKRGVKIIGASAHYVTEELDEGPIISQKTLSVSHEHSVNEMIEAGRNIERTVLSDAVKAHIENRIFIHGKRTIIFHG